MNNVIRKIEKVLHAFGYDRQAISYYLEQLNSMWSLTKNTARVVAIRQETPDTKSYWLQPNWRWNQLSARAGQHIGVTVAIDGKNHTRRYSLSAAPTLPQSNNKLVDANLEQTKLLRITIKNQPDGLVSNYINNNLQVNDKIQLSKPEGDFLIHKNLNISSDSKVDTNNNISTDANILNNKQAPSNSLLFIAAGSGITPIVALLQDYLQHNHLRQSKITLLHYVRSAEDRILFNDIQQLAEQHPQLDVRWFYDADVFKSAGNRSTSLLKHLLNQVDLFESNSSKSSTSENSAKHNIKRPNFSQTFLCGPAAFMHVVQDHWTEIGLSDTLSYEQFGLPAERRRDGEAADLKWINGERLQIPAGSTILEALLKAGKSPKHGCKRGVCHECKCRKESGVVKNLLTGRVSSQASEDIQRCISVPLTNIQLAVK